MPRSTVPLALALALLLLLPALPAAAALHRAPVPRSDPPDATPVTAVSTGPWTNVTSSTSPSPPGGAGAVFVNDSADEYDLWFGGSVAHAGGPIGETWTYRNGNWSNLTATQPLSPPARTFASVAFDSADGYVVLFGGLGDPSYRNDTWIFTGGNWSNDTGHLSVSPPARAEAAMAYDSATRSVVLFGGQEGSGPGGDTWAFSGGVWNELTPPRSPPASCCGELAYDPGDSEAVLVTSDAADGSLSTWTFASGTWTNRTDGTGPSGRQFSTFVDDPGVGGDVLFGGTALPRSPYWPLGDAWIFAGNRWIAAPGGGGANPNPGPRWGAVAAAELPTDQCFLLVGGAGINGSAPRTASLWEGCGNQTTWTNGSSSSGGGPNPPVLTLVPAALSGVAPFTTTVNITVRNGTAPFDLSVCNGPEGCVNPPPWNGSQPMHRPVSFPSAGVYSLSALVTDAAGLTASATATVTVRAVVPLTVAPVESPEVGVAPLTVYFLADVAGGMTPYEVQWSFGDGSVGAGSPGANLSHPFVRPGTYYPALEVTDARGTSYNLSLPEIVVVAPSHGSGAPANGWNDGDTLAVGILAVGLLLAVVLYAVRRRRLATEAEATIEELQTPEDPGEYHR